MIISRWIFPKMKNASDKSCRENQNSHFIFCNYIFFSRLLWDNVAKYGKARKATDDSTIQRVCIVCWITKAIDTLRICNTYCFSTTTIVTRTHHVTSVSKLLTLLYDSLLWVVIANNYWALFYVTTLFKITGLCIAEGKVDLRTAY